MPIALPENANLLPESAEWEAGLYQIETDDPVIGGVNGISNLHARQLGNRTLFLKQEIEALLAALGAANDALSAHAAGNDHPSATAAAKGMVALATVAEAIAGLVDDKAVTPEGLHAAVQAAVTALVDSSPAALDTLNELAAALGDDPNFATTITNLLAAKAPKESPALTGAPTAPTAPAGTNTDQIATTAFVLAQLLAGGYLRKDTSATLESGYWTKPVPLAIVGGVATPDLAAGNVFAPAAPLVASLTLAWPASLGARAGMFLLVIKQDGTGGRTLTMASGYKLAAGSWSTAANATNLLWITSDGSGAALDVVIAQRGA